MSDHQCSVGVLSLPIIIVVIGVEINWLWFGILSGDDRIGFHG